MKIYRFDAGVGKPFEQHDSVNFIYSRIAKPEGRVSIGCIYLGIKGIVGYHQNVGPQLFLVVAGSGWVRGQPPEKTPITPGYAAFWTAGEWHASGTDTGMTAIVIEGDGLDPSQLMVEIQ